MMSDQHIDGTELGTHGPRLQTQILDLLAERGAGKSICPSEVARLAGGNDWRGLMAAVRAATWEFEEQGKIAVLQRGRPVTKESARGPVRIALAVPSGG